MPFNIEPFLMPYAPQGRGPADITAGARAWEELEAQRERDRMMAEDAARRNALGRAQLESENMRAASRLQFDVGQEQNKRRQWGADRTREWMAAPPADKQVIQAQMEANGFEFIPGQGFVPREEAAKPAAPPPPGPGLPSPLSPLGERPPPAGVDLGGAPFKPEPLRSTIIGEPGQPEPGWGQPQYAPGAWNPVEPGLWPTSIGPGPEPAAARPSAPMGITKTPSYAEMQPPPEPAPRPAPAAQPAARRAPQGPPLTTIVDRDINQELITTPGYQGNDLEQLKGTFRSWAGQAPDDPDQVAANKVGEDTLTANYPKFGAKAYDMAVKARTDYLMESRGLLNVQAQFARARASGEGPDKMSDWMMRRYDKAIADAQREAKFGDTAKTLDTIALAREELALVEKSKTGTVDFNLMKNLIKTTDPRQTDKDVSQMQTSAGWLNTGINLWEKVTGTGKMTPEFIAGLKEIIDATEVAVRESQYDAADKAFNSVWTSLSLPQRGRKPDAAMRNYLAFQAAYHFDPDYEPRKIPKTAPIGGETPAPTGERESESGGFRVQGKAKDVNATLKPKPKPATMPAEKAKLVPP